MEQHNSAREQTDRERRILLIGGGGHCRSVLDALLSLGTYREIGLVDRPGTVALGLRAVGEDEDLPRLRAEGWTDAFITLGSVGDAAGRRRLWRLVKELGYRVPVVADPSAVIAASALLEEGVFIGKRAVVNSGALIGCCAIVNTGAIVEHDCAIGAFAHISPGAVLCGEVTVGDDAHVGAAAAVRQRLRIGRGALIGLGSVVVRDVPEGTKAYGNPCRVVE